MCSDLITVAISWTFGLPPYLHLRHAVYGDKKICAGQLSTLNKLTQFTWKRLHIVKRLHWVTWYSCTHRQQNLCSSSVHLLLTWWFPVGALCHRAEWLFIHHKLPLITVVDIHYHIFLWILCPATPFVSSSDQPQWHQQPKWASSLTLKILRASRNKLLLHDTLCFTEFHLVLVETVDSQKNAEVKCCRIHWRCGSAGFNSPKMRINCNRIQSSNGERKSFL